MVTLSSLCLKMSNKAKMKPSIRTKIGLLCSIFIALLLLMGSSFLWNLSGVVELFRSSVEISGKAIKDMQLLQQVVIDA